MNTEAARSGSEIDIAEVLVHELLLSREGRIDPYPRYRRLRELAPVHRSQLGLWILSRYDDCAALLEDSRPGKDYTRQNESRIGPQWHEHVSLTASARQMVNLDGPEHARLRRLVAKAFTRSTIDALRPSIARTAHELLDRVAEAGTAEILQEVAFPLALRVIGEMLGMPKADLPWFPQLVRDLLAVFEMRPTPEQLAVADQAQLKFRAYFQDLISQKRREPGQDLLSTLISTVEGGDRLNDDELCAMATLLFGAGFETTANQLGNSLLALLTYPAEMTRLRADESLLQKLPDELLRYDGTTQMTVRVTTVAIEIGGTTIPGDETVLVLLGAANRDPSRYPEPDRLDVTRANIRPLTFGGGIHHCLGAALARVELEIAIRAFLERFDEIELVAPPRFRDRLTIRGLEALHLKCRTKDQSRHRH